MILEAVCIRGVHQGGPCGWTVQGPDRTVDLEARRHTGEAKLQGPGHPTMVRSIGRAA